MRRQSHLVEVKSGIVTHEDGTKVPFHVFTHVNKADDPQRIVRRNERKEMERIAHEGILRSQGSSGVAA